MHHCSIPNILGSLIHQVHKCLNISMIYRDQFYVPLMAHSVGKSSQMTSDSHALNNQTKTLCAKYLVRHILENLSSSSSNQDSPTKQSGLLRRISYQGYVQPVPEENRFWDTTDQTQICLCTSPINPAIGSRCLLIEELFNNSAPFFWLMTGISQY